MARTIFAYEGHTTGRYCWCGGHHTSDSIIEDVQLYREAMAGAQPAQINHIEERMSGLPTDPKARKAIPIWSGFIKYFPLAIAAVAELSRIGNDQHNPGKPLHWDRSKSGDELDAQARHMLDMAIDGEDFKDTDEVYHATKNAWRAMANLQKLLEKQAERAKEVKVDVRFGDDGWIMWDGTGEHPSSDHDLVEAVLRDGSSTGAFPASAFRWTIMAIDSDIIKYRKVNT